ncbi:WAT1-related protein At4g08290-like [Abrus precatorius]|uniref:WAT1-related protein n=1 Tax=Abrus precatorius TaxID=3816 RepID=A0A8B8LR68_ABRPR|nr:WAT1-related protein At4g08290-like [Abrus precatorius]
MGTLFNNAKPYLLLLAVQFGSAGMFIFAMDAIKKGMSHYVFIVYRNAIASITLAPFAFVLERKVRPKMTLRVFSEIMALAFFEIILDQCFALLGMKFTSASFLSAVMNSAPSITFVMAVILRLEHMKIKELACQAKVLGTIVTLGGTLLMALYKGHAVVGSSTNHVVQPENVNNPTSSHWIVGTCFILIGCVGFSAFYILQTITLRKYPVEMSLATLVCFVGALQSSVVAALAEWHQPHAWSLGWDTRLFAPAYAGIITSGVQYYIQGMVIKSMGPVIVTAFNPLRMIIVTALACIILSEQLYLGSIIGAIVVVFGLYLVVWGKSKECKGRIPPSPAEDDFAQNQRQLPVTAKLVPHCHQSNHGEATISK